MIKKYKEFLNEVYELHYPIIDFMYKLDNGYPTYRYMVQTTNSKYIVDFVI